MRAVVDEAGRVAVRSKTFRLEGIAPVINGVVLSGRAQVLDSPAERLRLRFGEGAAGRAGFTVEVGPLTGSTVAEGGLALTYGLEGEVPEPLDSFGLHIAGVENVRAWLRSGYFSWDGSGYMEPEAARDRPPETGYALTQILPRQGSGSLVLGFERHDRFQHSFTWDAQQSPPALTIVTLWDRKARGEAAVRSERLAIFQHPEVEAGLRAWARRVAEAARLPARLPADPIRGWCSWYNLYAGISEENVLEHLAGVSQAARREKLPMQVFQIDDGFTPEMGDWLEVKAQFPRGMGPLLEDIRREGFVPGLWIAPFMVGNRSRLFQAHPEWVVKDRDTGGPLVQMRFYGEFRWHKRSEEYYILDTTHPEAFEYLRRVFRTWRREWGCEYFKTDFMHFGSEHGPQRAIWHTAGLTRIEIWRRTAEMIREEIGEALWLGCGCPLWAGVGLVDGVRIGRDVGVEWQGNQPAQSLLRDQASRSFASGLLWLADPDCILVRERFHHLSEAEQRALAVYAGMAGGVILTSDNLAELSPAGRRLWRLVLPEGPFECRYPCLGRAGDPLLVQVRTGWLPGQAPEEGRVAAVFVLNPTEQPRQGDYALAELGVAGPAYLYDWFAGEAGQAAVARVQVELAAHAGVLLLARCTPWEAAPDWLPVTGAWGEDI